MKPNTVDTLDMENEFNNVYAIALQCSVNTCYKEVSLPFHILCYPSSL